MSSTPYDRQTSFALYSAENPSEPHSGSTLDAEFNAVKLAVDDTQQNLALIQDDDGALKRGSVGQEQFDSSVSIGFGAPSQWASGQIYTANVDTVFRSSKFYIANVTHTSGVSFEPANWDEIADFTLAAVIDDGSITSAKLADAAVGSDKLADGVVSSTKLATGAVSTNKIADSAVTFAKLATDIGPSLANLILPAGLGPIPWSLPTLPTGWDWADGTALLADTAFPTLRAAYIAAGFPFGQDGSGNPKKPGTSGKVIAGPDGGASLTAAGSTTGSATFNIAQNQLPNVNLALVGIAPGAPIPLDTVPGVDLLFNSGAATSASGPFPALVPGTFPITALKVTLPAPAGNTRLNGNVTQVATSLYQPTLAVPMIIKAH